MSAESFIQRHIRNLPLFARLSNDQINAVAAICELIRLEPGQLAFKQNEPTKGMMLMVGGRGVLTRQNVNGLEEPIGAVETGQYINESALYASGRETANLRIVQSAIIILIPRGRFVHVLTRFPELRTNLRVQTAPDQREATRKLFKGQRENETVFHVYRHHWWSFGRWLWIPVLVGAFLFVGAASVTLQSASLGLVLAGLGIIIPGAIIAYLVYEWQDDSVVITDQRVVRIWNTLLSFENTLNEIPLDRILEINAEIPPGDPFARLLTYGTVAIRTSGDTANILLPFTPRPMEISRMLFQQKDQFQQQNEMRRREAIRADIEQALGRRQPGAQTADETSVLVSAENATVGPAWLRTKYLASSGEIIYRKHVSVWVAHIFIPTLLILGGMVLFFLSLVPSFAFNGIIGFVVSVGTLLIGLLAFYLADWDWRNDTFVVSAQSITLIRKRPLFLQNQVDTIRLAQVDNVRSNVNGIFNTLLNRGNVHISLIGSESNAKVFDRVYDPQSIQAEISQRLNAVKAAQSRAGVDQQRQQLIDYLSVYQQMVGQPTDGVIPAQRAPQAQPTQPTYRPAPPPVDDANNPPPSAPPRDANRPPRIPR
ncbi:MAG: cyclic nucleotide-binding domain-containing protein [Anaerolinea sp.]|nr:cyclic nucleotide-binding domain-containing protein [Anaerolinea sp.]